MSNLRTDAREYAIKTYKVADMSRTFIERLCNQIDAVEEDWHAAERRAVQYAAERDRLLALPSLGKVEEARRALFRCVARTVKRTRDADIGRWYEVEGYYDALLAAEGEGE